MSDSIIHMEDAFLALKIANTSARLQRIKAEHEARRVRLPAVTYPTNPDIVEDNSWRFPCDGERPFS